MEPSLCEIYVTENKPRRPYLKEEINEYRIQQIWLEGIKPEEDWRTEEGDSIRILSPGHHNPHGGPDFKDALVEINGLPYRGDIEIHQRGEEWYLHGHHKDSRYDRVILHIVLGRKKDFIGAINSKGHTIPTFIFPRSILEKEEESHPPKDDFTSPCTLPPCLEPIQFDYDFFVRILSQQRVFRRMEQMRLRLREVSIDDMIYEFLFYSLGMGTKYASLYTQLARLVPYPQARRWLSEDPRILEAIFLFAIGYLQKGVELQNPYALLLEEIRKRNKVEEVGWRGIGKDAPYSAIPTHPRANPAIRIAWMIGFLSKMEDSLSAFLYALGSRSMLSPHPWMVWEESFYVHHYYWSYYNQWDMKRNRTPNPLIGRERIYSILGNVLIPFFLLSIQEGLWGEREENIWRMYYQLPGENTHWLLKRMQSHADFLFSHRRLKFFEQQALIHWYHSGCSSHPQCVDCPWKQQPLHSSWGNREH